jgi:hypothetical protein|tara:strand:+ start:2771 stop:3013 length:243 start_codon:yes stop_codon:yes gene_type:complete
VSDRRDLDKRYKQAVVYLGQISVFSIRSNITKEPVSDLKSGIGFSIINLNDNDIKEILKQCRSLYIIQREIRAQIKLAGK